MKAFGRVGEYGDRLTARTRTILTRRRGIGADLRCSCAHPVYSSVIRAPVYNTLDHEMTPNGPGPLNSITQRYFRTFYSRIFYFLSVLMLFPFTRDLHSNALLLFHCRSNSCFYFMWYFQLSSINIRVEQAIIKKN